MASLVQGPVDWQISKQTVRERTAHMFNNILMSDVKFVVADSAAQDEAHSRQVRIPAHKLILAISSPVFEAMFYGAMAEKKEEIELPDANSEQLLEFLRFVYCEDLNLSPHNILSILYLAKKYIVPSLEQRCREFLEKEMNETNVLEILIQAQKMNETKIEQDCWKIVDDDTDSCLESEGLHHLDRDTVTKLLQRDSLMVHEVTLFDAIRKWAQERCKQQGLEHSSAQMRQLLGDAVYHFRFPLMSAREFGQYVVPSGVLTEGETINMLMYFNSLASPENLNFSTKPRSLSHQWKESLLRLYGTGRSKYLPLLEFMLGRQDVRNDDCIDITVKKVTYFAGVRLFVCKEEGKCFDARLSLKCKDLNGNEVSIQQTEGTFTTERRVYRGMQWSVGFDVMLEKPVLLRKSEPYTLRISIYRRNMDLEWKYSDCLSSSIRGRGTSRSVVEVTIKGRSGHILELLMIERS